MSYYDYKIGLEISKEDYPFYGLIQAAIRQADTVNLLKLTAEFPDIVEEVKRRYNSPMGLLPGESVTVEDMTYSLLENGELNESN